MKKFASVILLAVLASSFMVGAIITDTQAKNGPNNDGITPACKLALKEPACNLDDCRLYWIYSCPWGIEEVWTGEYCPAGAPCWGPFEP